MLKYVGGGTHIHGVPARDLTDAEQKQFASLIADQERKTGLALYEPVTVKKEVKS